MRKNRFPMCTSPIAIFIEEIEKLEYEYPEIINNIGLIIIPTSPGYGAMFDPRLFGSFTEHLRKLVILKSEPIYYRTIHKQVIGMPIFCRAAGEDQKKLVDYSYKKIEAFLDSKIDDAQCRVSIQWGGVSPMRNYSVYTAINTFLSAEYQHAKPLEKAKVFELRALTFNTFDEIIRIIILDLIKLLIEYKNNIVNLPSLLMK